MNEFCNSVQKKKQNRYKFRLGDIIIKPFFPKLGKGRVAGWRIMPPPPHNIIHTYIHTFIHKYFHTYEHTYLHTYIHIRTYIHTNNIQHSHIGLIYIHTYIHMHATYKNTHKYIHTYFHRYMYTDTHAQIHSYI